MSRCFPFPPPGYEEKTRIDDISLLKKELHRKKESKKEKKDKEEGESREKKEKDRHGGKHRDKKQKRGKRHDKKKDKDENDKDKDKSCTTEEKKIVQQPENCNLEMLDWKDRLWDHKTHISTVQEHVHSGKSHSGSGVYTEGTSDFIFINELDKRTGDEKGCTSPLVDRVSYTVQKNDKWINKMVVKDNKVMVGREEKMEKIVYCGNLDRGVGFDPKYGRLNRLEREVREKMQEKERFKEREDDEKKSGKKVEKHIDMKQLRKDKIGEKEEKKGEKGGSRSGDKYQGKLKNVKGGTTALNVSISQVDKDGVRNTSAEEKHRKRKDLEANQLWHDVGARPDKMPRHSPHLSTQNREKPGRSQNPSVLSYEKPGLPNNSKADHGESKLNGVIEIAWANQIAQVSTKPPHPDTKYLSEVLTVPKVEEWSCFDDEDWIFSTRSHLLQKPGFEFPAMIPNVWAEAVEIDSADIFALPYVIPY